VESSLSRCLCLSRVLLLPQGLVASQRFHRQVVAAHRSYCYCALPVAVKTMWVPDLGLTCQHSGGLTRGSVRQWCDKSLGRHTFHSWFSAGSAGHTPGRTSGVSATLSRLHPSWSGRVTSFFVRTRCCQTVVRGFPSHSIVDRT